MNGQGQFVEQVKETVNTLLAQVHTCDMPGHGPSLYEDQEAKR